jgi:putative DNA primase/helicase
MYKEEGLKPPKEVQEAIDSYAGDSDKVHRFLSECTTKATVGIETASNLFNAYKKWCEVNKFSPGSDKAFSANLKGKGYQQKKQRVGGSNSISCFIGIKLKY